MIMKSNVTVVLLMLVNPIQAGLIVSKASAVSKDNLMAQKTVILNWCKKNTMTSLALGAMVGAAGGLLCSLRPKQVMPKQSSDEGRAYGRERANSWTLEYAQAALASEEWEAREREEAKRKAQEKKFQKLLVQQQEEQQQLVGPSRAELERIVRKKELKQQMLAQERRAQKQARFNQHVQPSMRGMRRSIAPLFKFHTKVLF